MNAIFRKIASIVRAIRERMRTALAHWIDRIAPWEDTLWPDYVENRERRYREERAREEEEGEERED